MKPKDKKIIHKSIDGELNKTETRILKRKLESDGHVRAEYEALKKVSESAGEAAPHLDVPPHFRDEVIRKLGQPPQA